MIWMILGGLIGLVLVLFAIGWMLPAHYSSGASAVLPAPPEAVWGMLIDHERTPCSSHMCKGIERLPDQNGAPCWREDIGSSAITVRSVEQEPPRRIVRELEDSVVPMRARWELELEPVAAGTAVSVQQTGTIERGTWHVPLFRIAIHLGAARAGMKAYLRRLATNLGERVAVQ